jgi:CMP-N,N'-diacetyllegionaminic acid synthase
MSTLFLIPARAGSKGLLGKNTKLLGKKPLILYSIEFAKSCMKPGDQLCISSDDEAVFRIAEDAGVEVPFCRPATLSSDTASSHDVMMHAMDHYENLGWNFEKLLLLQPTSPFRNVADYNKMLLAYTDDIDLVVSVTKSKENPYFTLFEENALGYLVKSKLGYFDRRQDCPEVYALNGSMYLINIASLKQGSINTFTRINKILMPEDRSVDIDTMADWVVAEYYLTMYENS